MMAVKRTGDIEFIEVDDVLPMSQQDDEVIEYIASICRADKYGLNEKGFYERICSSIINNGVAFTADIYDLDEKIVKAIKIK